MTEFTKNYYEILGVHPEANEEEIRAAYRELARIHHPDSLLKAQNPGGAAADNPELFKSITEAYALLNNPDKRREYDYWLAEKNKGSSLHWLKKKPENEGDLSAAAKEHFLKKKAGKQQSTMNRFENEKIRLMLICLVGVFTGVLCALFVFLLIKLVFRF